MNYLLDTCLISELVKKEPQPGVIRWLEEQSEQTLFLSVLTFGELQKGISRLSAGERRDTLQNWVKHDLADRFHGRILGLDLEIALAWGRLQGESEQAGEKLPVMDSLIAATAIAHGMTVVTRNRRDLERCRTRVFDPWQLM